MRATKFSSKKHFQAEIKFTCEIKFIRATSGPTFFSEINVAKSKSKAICFCVTHKSNSDETYLPGVHVTKSSSDEISVSVK